MGDTPRGLIVSIRLADLDSLKAELSSLRAEKERAEAERDAAFKDAERYRWLRQMHTTTRALLDVVRDDCNPPYFTLKAGDDLDAAIDAARKGEQ